MLWHARYSTENIPGTIYTNSLDLKAAAGKGKYHKVG